MMDTLTTKQRSALMGKVKSKGNRSTELKVLAGFQDCGITGWIQHPSHIPGRPDFWFEERRIALFVDGCFWHGCPKCGRIPKTREEFWRNKIEGNRRRDLTTSRLLRQRGCRVVRVWEHELNNQKWVCRVLRTLNQSAVRIEMNNIAESS